MKNIQPLDNLVSDEDSEWEGDDYEVVDDVDIPLDLILKEEMDERILNSVSGLPAGRLNFAGLEVPGYILNEVYTTTQEKYLPTGYRRSVRSGQRGGLSYEALENSEDEAEIETDSE